MRHIVDPTTRVSRDVGSRVSALRGAPVRTALSVLGLAMAYLGLPAASAVAAPTTTTTLSPMVVLAGNAYARNFLDAQPVPPGARKVPALPTPLPLNGDFASSPFIRQDHHLYVLPMSVSVDAFVRAHLLHGERVTETGSGSAPNTYPTYNLGVSATCVSPHITFCGVYYQTTEARNGEQELRVDVQVIYLPIIHVAMPTGGVVTVTGYGTTSLMDSSSDPTTVVLSHRQVLTLHTVIAHMKNLGFEDGCMENSLLLKIHVVKHGHLVWSATAEACPGALAISSATSNPILDGRSCSFWHVVDTFFAPGTATATRAQIRGCSVAPYSSMA